VIGPLMARGRVGYHFSPRYFAVKTHSVDGSRYAPSSSSSSSFCNQSDTPGSGVTTLRCGVTKMQIFQVRVLIMVFIFVTLSVPTQVVQSTTVSSTVSSLPCLVKVHKPRFFQPPPRGRHHTLKRSTRSVRVSPRNPIQPNNQTIQTTQTKSKQPKQNPKSKKNRPPRASPAATPPPSSRTSWWGCTC
jgi:hypothetical protein